MIIRLLDDGDLDALRTLWHRTWCDTYGMRLGTNAEEVIAASLAGEAVRSMLAADGACLVAVDSGTVVASICFAERGRITYVWGMYVRPDRQRRGIGTALLRQTIAMLTTSHRVALLAVDPSAVAFYRSLGFTPEGLDDIMLFPGLTVPATRLVRDLGGPAVLTPAPSGGP